MGLTIYQAFFATMYVTISMYSSEYREADRKEGFKPKTEYDFIIVGSGTAGSILANRLSEKNSVLLIENGGPATPPQYTPAAFSHLPFIDKDEIYTYMWKTVKQNNSATATDGITEVVQGKGLGGSTVLNAMIYNRGHKLDFDNWAQQLGDPTWRYDELKKYFQAFENYKGDPKDGMGVNGELPVSLNNNTLEGDQFEWLKQWMAAGEELGFKSNLHPNPDLTEGFHFIHENKEKGHRITAFDAFVKPVEKRDTLSVVKYANVLKVEIDNSGSKATSVKFVKDGTEYNVNAKKEIILSAGALNTPKILMNSGIGPAEDLRKAKIQVKRNLPVGQFLQDHVSVILKPSKVAREPWNHFNSTAHKEEFDEFGTGPMSNTQGRFAQAYLRSEIQKQLSASLDWPDLQFMAIYNSSYVHNGDNFIGIRVTVTRPSSFGWVKLNDQDPQLPLIFNPNYLGDENDVNRLADGIKKAVAILDSEEFRKTGAELDKTPVPECPFDFDSDEYRKCYGKAFTQTVWHPLGTARMGRQTDQSAVVDPTTFKVWGMSNLRVVDNSIAHSAINTYTNALAYLIGQKGSDIILKSNRNRRCWTVFGIEYCLEW